MFLFLVFNRSCLFFKCFNVNFACSIILFWSGDKMSSPVRYSYLSTLPDNYTNIFVAFLLMLYCRFSSIIFVIRKVFFWETSSMKFHLWGFINHSTSEMYYKSNIINLKRCLLFCTLPADFHEIILVYVIWMIHSNLLKSEFITYFLDKIAKFNKISLGTAYLCIKNKRDT